MARRIYSLDFKVSAAKLVTEQGYGNKKAATSLGVAPSTMQYWVRRFGTAPARTGPAPDQPAALKAEVDRLREENRRLLMERDILRKATAFFAGERAWSSASSATTGTSSRWR